MNGSEVNKSMVNKLAIFVEGRTEQIFVERLVRFLGESVDLAIRVDGAEGGRHKPRRFIRMSGTRETEGYEFFVLIVNCGQDARVKSDILKRYNRLVSQGYRYIIGIRDVHPHDRKDTHHIRQGFQFGLPTTPCKPVLILAIMEIEAWFLAEYAHFPRIHPSLTRARIGREFGFDPAEDDMQLRDHPARDLEAIYFLEAIPYAKSRENVERTVDSLDFSRIRDEVAARIADLARLTGLIRAFFTYSEQTDKVCDESLPRPRLSV
uniref:DUF4276 family protein n=1 Tax=Candidatus Kentrum sp. LFY TaxID=2126342 RepID=A0A450U7B6_9GAMM|nr:MAG: hypothetical protein BECKLFY1418B_GA0070995_100751 [Candidatus Kentron sp. LFY]VFJ93541.1 MAG: hypothetical protein BECKLFY1418A_GA0070994_103230 [Candidatus Kentron sp. LFY]